jgi:hypothetical protein
MAKTVTKRVRRSAPNCRSAFPLRYANHPERALRSAAAERHSSTGRQRAPIGASVSPRPARERAGLAANARPPAGELGRADCFAGTAIFGRAVSGVAECLGYAVGGIRLARYRVPFNGTSGRGRRASSGEDYGAVSSRSWPPRFAGTHALDGAFLAAIMSGVPARCPRSEVPIASGRQGLAGDVDLSGSTAPRG